MKGHGPLLLTLTLVCSTFEEKSLPSSSATRTRIYTRVHPQNSLISQGMLDLTGSEYYCWWPKTSQKFGHTSCIWIVTWCLHKNAAGVMWIQTCVPNDWATAVTLSLVSICQIWRHSWYGFNIASDDCPIVCFARLCELLLCNHPMLCLAWKEGLRHLSFLSTTECLRSSTHLFLIFSYYTNSRLTPVTSTKQP